MPSIIKVAKAQQNVGNQFKHNHISHTAGIHFSHVRTWSRLFLKPLSFPVKLAQLVQQLTQEFACARVVSGNKSTLLSLCPFKVCY